MNDRTTLLRRARLLALFTILYNVTEGIVSVIFGFDDETISLFGFGLDSFVEVVSGIGVWHMIRRIEKEQGSPQRDRFEQRALRITGGAFYLLALGLAATAAATVTTGHRPANTFWGVVVAVVSIVSMKALIHFKVKVGTALDSPAILADAACTSTCLYLSVILLGASLGYMATGIGYVDSVGSAAIAWFSLKEGREAFAKARGLSCGCGGTCGGR